MDEDYIEIDEDFPYSDFTDNQLADKIKELSNRLVNVEDIENINKIIYYSQIALSALSHKQLYKQTELFKSQIEVLQTSVTLTKKDSKSARNYSVLALFVTGIFGLFTVLTYFGVEYPKDANREQQKLITLQEQQLMRQDSLVKTLNQIRNDIQVYGQQNRDFFHKKSFGR